MDDGISSTIDRDVLGGLMDGSFLALLWGSGDGNM